MPVAYQHQLQIAQCPFCHDKMIIKVQTCLSFPYKCQSYQSWKINSKSHMKAVSSSLTLGRKAFENVWLCKISTSLTATTGHIQEVIKSIICCVIRHQCQSLQVLPGTIYQCYCQVKSAQSNLENNLFLSQIQWWLWSSRQKSKNGRCKNYTRFYVNPEILFIFSISVKGSYSYMSLRARTPSVERNPDTSNKQLRFPKYNTKHDSSFFLILNSDPIFPVLKTWLCL